MKIYWIKSKPGVHNQGTQSPLAFVKKQNTNSKSCRNYTFTETATLPLQYIVTFECPWVCTAFLSVRRLFFLLWRSSSNFPGRILTWLLSTASEMTLAWESLGCDLFPKVWASHLHLSELNNPLLAFSSSSSSLPHSTYYFHLHLLVITVSKSAAASIASGEKRGVLWLYTSVLNISHCPLCISPPTCPVTRPAWFCVDKSDDICRFRVQ